MNANTLFLRLEGSLQAWGNQESKFVVRRTAAAPTKSGVIGLLLAALGMGRAAAPTEWLPRLNALEYGVRIDRPGVRWWDYHTVGAGIGVRKADGGIRDEPLLSRREYLCDASFLVVLRGEVELIAELHHAVQHPKWTLYLGRKCCPPGRPLLEVEEKHQLGECPDLASALCAVPWQPRLRGDQPPAIMDCLQDWVPTPQQPKAPPDALVHYDVPVSLEPPAHIPRFVIASKLSVGPAGTVQIANEAQQSDAPAPQRIRADYRNTEYRKARARRLAADNQVCVFCKLPATTVQHITYRRAGGSESQADLRALCRLCHDAVTMIEYGEGMGLDRINPEDPQWRDQIQHKRQEIIQFRSLETRRRWLEPQEVE